METPLLFSLCSLLMASLFALSASMQFNDPDWYFWLPLYAIACAVNLVNGVFTQKITKQVSKFGLWLGIFLFIKVVLEDLIHGISRFWSLNLRDRVVREKFGSGLVISCMFLHLQASSKTKAANYVQYGMVVLVGISYGLSFVFFVFQQREMKI